MKKSHLHVNQKGVAALEFALIAIVMIIMLLCLLVWWQYFQTHQIITRAAGDSARMAHSLISTGTSYPCAASNAATNKTIIQDRITQVARLSVERGALSSSKLEIGSFLWACPPSNGAAPGTFSFTLNYQMDSLIGGSNFISEQRQMSEKSTVHFRPIP